jgi:hypothetical protein
MNKKIKIAGLVAVICLVVITSIIFFRTRNENDTEKLSKAIEQKNGLPMADLIEKKNTNDDGLASKKIGKIQAIKEGELDISDENNPIKQMTKNKVSPIIPLKINNQSAVFFVNKNGSQEKKLLSDLHINDSVVISYDNLTQKAVTIYVLIGGASPDQINFNK